MPKGVSHGPAKGPGNGLPMRPPFNSETGRAAGRKSAFVRRKMAEYRKANPGAPMSMSERERMIREALREVTPDILDTMITVAQDADHKDFGPTSRALIEHDLGKPRQSVHLSGEDGGAINLISRIELVPVEPVPENEA